MTVAKALELPVLRRGLPEVVAGADSLDRPIRWVHAGEAPDIASLLRGGELLLTTGMGIGGARSQRRFVADLASRDVAGLVVELGTSFLDRLPEGLVRAAEDRGLPLVELHSTVRFVTVTEAIHTEIVNRDYELLRRGDALRRRFTAAMVSGEGVPEVLAILAEELANPVFLQTHDGRLLAHASPQGTATEDALDAWGEARGRAGTIGVSGAVASAGGRPPGELVALPREAPFDAFAQLAVEQAADIVSLALLRSRQEDELLALGRGELLARLADRRITPRVAAARAGDMGFLDRGVSLLPVVSRLAFGSGEPGAESAAGGLSWTGALRDLESELAPLGVPRLIGLHPVDADVLLLLLALRDVEDRTRLADGAAAALGRAARRVGGDPAVAVGAACSWETVGDGFRDAIEATAVAGELRHGSWLDATTVPLERLLWRLGESEDLHRYVERVLGPVIAHDEGRKQRLLPTLEAFCANGGRKTATARALNLNRQALYARLARLERLLGLDLAESEAMATIDLALRARNHLRPGGPRVR